MIKSHSSDKVSPYRVDIVRKKAIGHWGEQRAVEFLTVMGFTKIEHSKPINQVYDLEAIDPEGTLCIIEVRTRSAEAKTQFFTLRNTKIRNIELACQQLNIKNAYFVLINKFGFNIVSLKQIKEKTLPSNLKLFTFKGHMSFAHSQGGLIAKTRDSKIEIKVTLKEKGAYNKMVAELTPGLQQKLQRRVYSEDVILLFLQVYQNYNWVFKEQLVGKAQIR